MLPGSFTSHDLIQYSICEQEHGRARCRELKTVKSYCSLLSSRESCREEWPDPPAYGIWSKGQAQGLTAFLLGPLPLQLHSAQPLLMA